MKLQKANSDNFKDRIKHYREKSIQELQLIHPKWAYGKDADNMLDSALHPKNNEYTIFFVDTAELIRNAELHELNSKILFTGDLINDGRIATILSRWENNKFVDPPTVEVFDRNKTKLCFSDGRHRTKVTYLLGCRQIPIAIHKSQIKKISKIILLTTL